MLRPPCWSNGSPLKVPPKTVLHDATIYARRAVLHSAQVGGVENGTSLLCGQLQIVNKGRNRTNIYLHIYYLILDDISIVYFLMSNNHRNVWVMPCHIWKKIQRHRHGIQPFGSMAHLSGNDRHISYLRCVLIGKSKHPNFKGSKLYIWLVVSTQLKNISQDGNLPQIGVKIQKK